MCVCGWVGVCVVGCLLCIGVYEMVCICLLYKLDPWVQYLLVRGKIFLEKENFTNTSKLEHVALFRNSDRYKVKSLKNLTRLNLKWLKNLIHPKTCRA